MLIVFFCTVFTIFIIKCKALFSCHSSSSHYSTQGFVLISFHFIFSFLIKNKKKKILCNFTSDLVLCLRISDLKCGQKTPKRMGPWEKTFPFFWSHLLAIISRNVGTKGHLRKEIVLLKYQVFQIWDKKWWPVWTLKFIGKKHKAFDVGGLWYCSFHHPLGRLQNLERIEWYRAYIVSTKSDSAVWPPVYNI